MVSMVRLSIDNTIRSFSGLTTATHASTSTESIAKANEDACHRSRQKHRLANKRLVESLLEDSRKRSSSKSRLSAIAIDADSWRGKVHVLVQHRYFSVAAASLVGLNAFYMGIEATVRQCNDAIETDAWYLVQVLFAVSFTTELALRLFAERQFFFQDMANSFDAFLVATSVADCFVLRYLVGQGDGKTLDLLVTLRFLRLARLARILRLIRFFKELWFLVEGILSATRTLSWAWLLTFVLLYLAAVFATRCIGKAVPSEAGTASPDELAMQAYFANVPTSMYSLFQVMSVEGWVGIARASIEVKPWTALFFIGFLSTTSFSIMHVVVAVIVQNTLAHASNRNEEEASARQAKEQEALVKIVQIFELSDMDGNGEVTIEEFKSALENEEVIKNLQQVNVDVRQAENLFEILDYDESGSLDCAEFVEGVMTARGDAQSKDLLAVQCDLWRAEQRLQTGLGDLTKAIRRGLGGDLQRSVNSFRKDVEIVLG